MHLTSRQHDMAQHIIHVHIMYILHHAQCPCPCPCTFLWNTWPFLSVPQKASWDRILHVSLSFRLAVFNVTQKRFLDVKWWKFYTCVLEVKSNIEFEDRSRTWPLTQSNWGSYTLHTCTKSAYSCVQLVYMALQLTRFIIQYLFIEFKSSAPYPHTTQYEYVSRHPSTT